MNSRAFSLVSTIVVAVLLIIGAVLSWMAAKTEIDPVTKQAVGDASAVHNSVVYTLALMWISVICVLGFTICRFIFYVQAAGLPVGEVGIGVGFSVIFAAGHPGFNVIHFVFACAHVAGGNI